MYRTRDVLILCALHQRIFVELMASVMRIAKDNVAIEFIGVNLCTDIHIRTDFLTHLYPVTLHTTVFPDKPFFLIWRVDKAINDLSLASTQQYAVSTIFCAYFINDIRVAMLKVEFLKRLLPRLNTQSHLVGIVEKEQCSQHRALAHTLCTGKVHITVQHHLCIRNICAIQKNDFVKMSHTSGVSSSL